MHTLLALTLPLTVIHILLALTLPLTVFYTPFALALPYPLTVMHTVLALTLTLTLHTLIPLTLTPHPSPDLPSTRERMARFTPSGSRLNVLCGPERPGGRVGV